jgi:hypothetical protein
MRTPVARTPDTQPGNADVLRALQATLTDIHDLLASVESISQQALDGKAAAHVPILVWSRVLLNADDWRGRVRKALDTIVMGGRPKSGG